MREVVAFSNIAGIVIERETQAIPAVHGWSDGTVPRIDEESGLGAHERKHRIVRCVTLVATNVEAVLREQMVSENELGERPVSLGKRRPHFVAQGFATHSAMVVVLPTRPWTPERIVQACQDAGMPRE